jgi:hypothetical protein
MKKQCWIHTGRGRDLCSRHRRAVIALAAQRNISEESAAFELRDFEHAVEDARMERAQELRAARRVIRDFARENRRLRSPERSRASS